MSWHMYPLVNKGFISVGHNEAARKNQNKDIAFPIDSGTIHNFLCPNF